MKDNNKNSNEIVNLKVNNFQPKGAGREDGWNGGVIVYCGHGPLHTLNLNGASGGGGRGNGGRWNEKNEKKRNEERGRQTRTVNINAGNGGCFGNGGDSSFPAITHKSQTTFLKQIKKLIVLI